MAIAKKIPQHHVQLRANKWQSYISDDLCGKTIGIIGLGRIGSQIATYAKAFGMHVIAWSEHLTASHAASLGVTAVSKETLLTTSDYVSLHLVLSDRTYHTIQKKDLELMKPTAYLINTSRGSLIKEEDLITHLKAQRIAGVALDVFEHEPLPINHPFRQLKNVLITPHTGYVTEATYKVFYQDTVTHIQQWCRNQKTV